MQIDSSLSASKTFPAETRSNNSGRYTLLKSHIPCQQPATARSINKIYIIKVHPSESVNAAKSYVNLKNIPNTDFHLSLIRNACIRHKFNNWWII